VTTTNRHTPGNGDGTVEKDQRIAVGDYVRLLPFVGTRAQSAATYVVTELIGQRISMEPVAGGRGLRAAHEHVRRLDPSSREYEAAKAQHQKVAGSPKLYPGSIVKVTVPTWKDGDGPYVVLAVAEATAKLARLGGDSGRYWPKIPIAALVAVDAARVIAAVPGPVSGTDVARAFPDTGARVVVSAFEQGGDVRNAWDVLVSAVGIDTARPLVLGLGDGGAAALRSINV
jgi:hypothetical protein